MTFSKSILASSIGTIIGGIVGIILLFVFIGIIVSAAGSDKEVEVKDDSILKISLSGNIVEKGSSPFEFDGAIPFMGAQNKIGLYEIRQALKNAKDDDRIKGVYINMNGFGAGFATMQALRQSIEDFKTSGKFVYAYAEAMGEGAYYLASTADKVYLYPRGGMEFNGLASTPYFLKGLFEKVGLEPRVFRVGTFKSAVEPFVNDKMSDANRLQMQTLLDDLWGQFLTQTAASRKLNSEDMDRLADLMSVRTPEDAVEAGLIDGLKFEDEVLDILMEETGKKKSKDLEFISLKQYSKVKPEKKEKKNRKNKIAIVFAQGAIVDGKGGADEIGSATIAPLIRKAREDSTVKAVVLRVNSPGGSALASDVIWREVVLTKKAKPVIVSMGDLAASGGYYISAAADRIFAEPTTITGSIGVFGLLFNTQKMFTQKLGVTFDRVYTNQYADLANPNRSMEEEEAAIIQESVDLIYGQFIGVVQEGRGFPDSISVDKIAQGRVWSGKRAIEIGLVDELGGLDEALAYAAEQAGIEDDYSIRTYPEEKDPFEEFLKSFGAASIEEAKMMEGFEEEMKLFKEIKSVISKNGVYMMMPQVPHIH